MAARISHPNSGRILEIQTNQPTFQIDFGDYMPPCTAPVDKRLSGKYQVRYIKNGCFIIQPQGFPDSINQKDFPRSILQPGDIYNNIIIYKFRTVKQRPNSTDPCDDGGKGDDKFGKEKEKSDCNCNCKEPIYVA